MNEFAPAKINLFLHVGQKRADGFHALQSLVAFADVGDRITIEAAPERSLVIRGPFAEGLGGESDNLVLRALNALAIRVNRKPSVHILLEKNLPVSSGIGGGSADAAATLRGLMRFWKTSLDDKELLAIASSLGSDVPVCLKSCSSWMEGRGERVEPAGVLPSAPMLLVNPGVSVPTAKIFSALRTRTGIDGPKPANWASLHDLIKFLKTTRNDLEEPALSIAPIIGDVLKVLSNAEGQILTRMSGSGATCFALFGEQAQRDQAARELSAKRPGWWIAPTAIAGAR